jgi:hypothetical protein
MKDEFTKNVFAKADICTSYIMLHIIAVGRDVDVIGRSYSRAIEMILISVFLSHLKTEFYNNLFFISRLLSP